jgi:hypothetical protein
MAGELPAVFRCAQSFTNWRTLRDAQPMGGRILCFPKRELDKYRVARQDDRARDTCDLPACQGQLLMRGTEGMPFRGVADMHGGFGNHLCRHRLSQPEERVRAGQVRGDAGFHEISR